LDSKQPVKRAQVSLKIKFKSETLEAFIERYAVDVSQGGIFIRTKEPQPVGTSMKFEFQLKDASPLLAGEGTVVWTREHDPSRPNAAPGMGVRFDKLGDGSQDVLDKILAAKSKQPARSQAQETKPPEFNEVPTRVAPSPLVNALSSQSAAASLEQTVPAPREDLTPLPPPTPFQTDAGKYGSDAFSESTKIRTLEEIAAETGMDLGAASAPSKPAPKLAATVPARGAEPMRAPDAGDFSAQPTRVAPDPGGFSDFGAQATRVQTLEELVKEAAGKGASAEISDALGELSARRAAGEATPTPSHVTEEAAAAVAAASMTAEDAAAGAPSSAARNADTTPPPDQQADKPADKPAERPRTPTREPRILDASPAARTRTESRAPVAAAAAAAPVPAPSQGGGGAGKFIALLLALAAGGFAVWYFVLRKKEAPTPAPVALAGGSALPSGSAPPGSAGSALGSNAPDAVGSDAGSGSAALGSDAGSALGSDAVGSAAGSGSAAITPPAANLVDTVIAAVAGSTVTVVATGASGPAPLTTKLAKGETYQVQVSAPGMTTKTVDVVGGKAPAKIKLDAKPRIVHVESTPAGGQIFVAGVNSKQVTPFDLTLTGSSAKAAKIKVAVRLDGYEDGSQILEAPAFVEQGENMVATVTVTLAKKPKRTTDKPDKTPTTGPTPDKPDVTAPTDTKPTDTKPTDTKPTDTKPADSTPTDTKPADPKPTEPQPSWMEL
jgi:uncharacterized protein (TIGR02266 family)